MATKEDAEWQLDYWAHLFKAKTWEEIKMFAEKNEYLQEAAQSVWVANEDEMVRQRCLAKEEYERHERTVQRDMKRLREQLQTAQEDGEKQYLLMLIRKKLEKGQSIEQIAESLEESVDVIEKLIAEM